MIKISRSGAYLVDGKLIPPRENLPAPELAREGTIAYSILRAHNVGTNHAEMNLRFDAMASHDITYVGIIQTARASGLEAFPLPYVLTNCHNSLCAVGGTINEDDHVFGLSAAKRYGGEFVPAHQAVIHSYMRERYAGSGRMIIGSDSHTRYGAYGTLAIGEGGPELARQLLNKTYDIPNPQVVCVYLTGAPRPGVGPQDIALELIRATFDDGVVKNRILEFVGPGIKNLSMDFRNGIDVMTTETACLSSVWQTDSVVYDSLAIHGRPDAYKKLEPANGAWYDAVVAVDMNDIEPMIALPFHPKNAYSIREFKENMGDILHQLDEAASLQFGKQSVALTDKLKDGRFVVDQAVIGGCSGGTFQNLCRTADMLAGRSLNGFSLSVYPASQPVMMELMRTGKLSQLMQAGVSVRSCFCGPCFGAGDVPSNGGFSIRHCTRNFPNREGSRPTDGQLSYVALMDARSIAATARNGGALTAATEFDVLPKDTVNVDYLYNDSSYRSSVYFGVGKPDPQQKLVFGPNIADWPEQIALPDNLLLTFTAAIYDEVTTTDELIPSGETSSYRSNPLKLSEFALSRRVPEYVGRCKEVQQLELLRRSDPFNPEVKQALDALNPITTGLGSILLALCPGDGSAREQAASCQRVLGGCANLCVKYATKRYRSNVINWGMLPFTMPNLEALKIQAGNQLYIPSVRQLLLDGAEEIPAVLIQDGKKQDITLELKDLNREQRDIILKGCLINYYAN